MQWLCHYQRAMRTETPFASFGMVLFLEFNNYDISSEGLSSMSQFRLSPRADNSSCTLIMLKDFGNGLDTVATPSILKSFVPPKGASSEVVSSDSMLRRFFDKTDVTLYTIPGLSAPESLNWPDPKRKHIYDTI